jgi:hypothetical protein
MPLYNQQEFYQSPHGHELSLKLWFGLLTTVQLTGELWGRRTLLRMIYEQGVMACGFVLPILSPKVKYIDVFIVILAAGVRGGKIISFPDQIKLKCLI